MTKYVWRERYNGIFLRYSIGYLADNRAIKFLRHAKEQLLKGSDRVSRQSKPYSFIFVIDNVLEAREKPREERGERVRSKETLEGLFEKAGLIIKAKTEVKVLHKTCNPAVIWAMY